MLSAYLRRASTDLIFEMVSSNLRLPADVKRRLEDISSELKSAANYVQTLEQKEKKK